MADWKRSVFLSLGLLACADTPQEQPAIILGRVGETNISEQDFTQALERLPAGTQAKTLEDWRQQFQVVVDKELLLFEARAQGLEETIAASIVAWERNQLVEELLEREMGEALKWTEAELAEFFAAAGADREIRLNRLMLTDRAQALEALQRARENVGFAQLGETYGIANWSESSWLNAFNTGDPRLAALFLLAEGAVELIEADGQYVVMGLAETRPVSLEDRRPLAETALAQRKKQQANLAYLEHLTGKYAVRLDTNGLRQTITGRVQPDLRLVSSTLGDWNFGDYQQALARLGAGGERLPDAIDALGFKVTRAFVADRLLTEEAKQHGLYEGLHARREKLREQKLIEALADREIFSQVQIDENEFGAFYEANKERYASLGENKEALQNQIVQDLRDAKAAPLFDRYIEQLRQRHAAIVAVNDELLGEFVSRRRQAKSPVDL